MKATAATARPERRVAAWLLAMIAAAIAVAGFVAGRVTAPPSGQGSIRVSTLSQGSRDSWPAVSPDGRLIAFSAVRQNGQGLWIMDLVSRSELKLTSGADQTPRFTADGGSIVFTRLEGGRLSLWRVPAIGGKPRLLLEDGFDVDPSPDGTRIAYITGRKEFWGLSFEVTPAVLIPRPETEIIVEAALARVPDAGERRLFADVCTGSGCIAVALARERRQWHGVATDLSARALASQVGVVHLHTPGELARLFAQPHDLQQLVFEQPRGSIANPEVALELQRRDAVLGLRQQVHCQEPAGQFQLGRLEDRAANQTALMAASQTLDVVRAVATPSMRTDRDFLHVHT